MSWKWLPGSAQYKAAFQCDSCLHKQVCSDEPNTRALDEECARYVVETAVDFAPVKKKPIGTRIPAPLKLTRWK